MLMISSTNYQKDIVSDMYYQQFSNSTKINIVIEYNIFLEKT